MPSTPSTTARGAEAKPASRQTKPRAPRVRAAATSRHDGEEREAIIRRIAYAHYEARGCVGGHALEDWLKAQAEFDAAATAQPSA